MGLKQSVLRKIRLIERSKKVSEQISMLPALHNWWSATGITTYGGEQWTLKTTLVYGSSIQISLVVS